jgi:hypothetical protein
LTGLSALAFGSLAWASEPLGSADSPALTQLGPYLGFATSRSEPRPLLAQPAREDYWLDDPRAPVCAEAPMVRRAGRSPLTWAGASDARYRVELVDWRGRPAWWREVTGTRVSVDARGLERGAYTLRVTLADDPRLSDQVLARVR